MIFLFNPLIYVIGGHSKYGNYPRASAACFYGEQIHKFQKHSTEQLAMLSALFLNHPRYLVWIMSTTSFYVFSMVTEPSSFLRAMRTPYHSFVWIFSTERLLLTLLLCSGHLANTSKSLKVPPVHQLFGHLVTQITQVSLTMVSPVTSAGNKWTGEDWEYVQMIFKALKLSRFLNCISLISWSLKHRHIRVRHWR